MAYRKDRLTVDRSDLPEPIERGSDGSVHVRMRIAKPGVMEYEDDNGETVKELVPKEELKKPSSLFTLAKAAVTDQHPRKKKVDRQNASDVIVGDLSSEVEYNSNTDYVESDASLRTDSALQSAKSGRVEVSPGYNCDLQPKDDLDPEQKDFFTRRYGDFDFVQRNRVYNHVALVDNARGGSDVRTRIDSSDEDVKVQKLDDTPPNPEEGVVVADPNTEWDGGEARQAHQEFYDFDPATDDTPEALRLNYAAYPPVNSEEFNSVSNFWGPFTDIIGGERKIVPNAVIALQNAIQRTPADEMNLPEGTTKSNLKAVVNPLWAKVWNAHGEDALPDPDPVWNRNDEPESNQEDQTMPSHFESLAQLIKTRLQTMITEERGKQDILKELAQKTGDAPDVVTQYLEGDKLPSAEKWKGMAQVLGVPAEKGMKFLEGEKQDEGELSQQLSQLQSQVSNLVSEVKTDQADQEEPEGQTSEAAQVDLPDEVQERLEEAGESMQTVVEAVKQLREQKDQLEKEKQKLQNEIDRLTGKLQMAQSGTGGEVGEGEDSSDLEQEEEEMEVEQNTDEEEVEGSDDTDTKNDSELRFDSTDDAHEYFEERFELRKLAQEYKIDSAKEKKNEDIKREILTEATNLDVDDMNASELAGAYEQWKETEAAAEESREEFAKNDQVTKHNDSKDEQQARKQQDERLKKPKFKQ